MLFFDLQKINNWEFVELWVDPVVFPPRILMVVGSKNSHCAIYDPARQYQLIFAGKNYEETRSWLLEDEYERVDGRILSEEVA